MKKGSDEKWLLDAEVNYRVEKENGRWLVSLIFIDTKDPTHFILKRISDYKSEKLAEIAAEIMMKSAARDKRGTQKVNRNDFDTNIN